MTRTDEKWLTYNCLNASRDGKTQKNKNQTDEQDISNNSCKRQWEYFLGCSKENDLEQRLQ